MKIIKKVLISIIILIIVFVITNANAYTGGVVDAGDEIEIPSILNNGNVTVNTATSLANSSIYYQFVEMDSNQYAKIRKLKDELNVARYYITYDENKTEQNYNNYQSARQYYLNKYGENLTNFSDARIDELDAKIIGNLPDYTNNWILTSNNIISLDLSSFSGTKYFTAWVKVQNGIRTVYDAQIYEEIGTKSDSNKEDTGNNTNSNVGVIDAGDEIKMPTFLTDGIGKVEIENSITNYQMYYQINEIETTKYNEIRKLKDELIVAKYYRIYDENKTEQNYDNYQSARQYYLNKYGENLTNFSDAHIDELDAKTKGLLPKYTDNWTLTMNNQINANLSSFTGTKDVVIWIKVVSGNRTVYDGDIYELTGTKQETTPGKEDKKDETDKPSTSDKEDKKDETDKTTASDKKNEDSVNKDNGNSSVNKVGTETKNTKLPYAGKTSNVFIHFAILMMFISCIVTYIKFKRI